MPEKECKEAWQHNHGSRRKIRGRASLSAHVTRGALSMRNACRGEKGEKGDLVSGKPVIFSGRQGKVPGSVMRGVHRPCKDDVHQVDLNITLYELLAGGERTMKMSVQPQLSTGRLSRLRSGVCSSWVTAGVD